MWLQLLVLSRVNSSRRSLPGLALAGDLQLHPTHAADGLHVLHAGDAPVPAVPGQEARGRGGAALPAGTRCPRGMGVRPHRGRLRGAGESTIGRLGGDAAF